MLFFWIKLWPSSSINSHVRFPSFVLWVRFCEESRVGLQTKWKGCYWNPLILKPLRKKKPVDLMLVGFDIFDRTLEQARENFWLAIFRKFHGQTQIWKRRGAFDRDNVRKRRKSWRSVFVNASEEKKMLRNTRKATAGRATACVVVVLTIKLTFNNDKAQFTLKQQQQQQQQPWFDAPPTTTTER